MSVKDRLSDRTATNHRVILREQGPERARGPEER